MKKILLSIAGFDPCSGAGILLDLKVFKELNFRGMGILTSLTAQNTNEIKDVHCPPPEFLWTQYETLKEDIFISGIKIGMVGCQDNIEVIKKILINSRDIPIVVDPVFKSSSGTWLLEKKFIDSYIKEIKGLVSLITPNLDEAYLISGISITDRERLKDAAKRIHSITLTPCLIKGSKINKKIVDILYDGQNFHFHEKKEINKKVHGTGCFLSSSLLCFLVLGKSLKDAFHLASDFTQKAWAKAENVGKGQNLIQFPIK